MPDSLKRILFSWLPGAGVVLVCCAAMTGLMTAILHPETAQAQFQSRYQAPYQSPYPVSSQNSNRYQPSHPPYPSSAPVFQTQAQQAAGPENILLILDASASMDEQLSDGETKMQAAKRVILETLQRVPPSVPIGLRVYGFRNYNSCHSSQLMVPISTNNRYQIASYMTQVHATGMTPISYSLRSAMASDFMNLPGRKTIILVSDGMETCGEDPCNVAVSMVQSGADVKINVVGYGLRDLDGIKQLRCVALATKAKFYDVNTAAELTNSLNNLFGAKKDVTAQILTHPNTGGGGQRISQPMPTQQPAMQPAQTNYPGDYPQPSQMPAYSRAH